MEYVIEPGWLLAEDNLSDYRENKVNKNYNPSPRFLPSDNFRPKYSKFPSADNVVIYERTAKPLKEEKTPPPKNNQDARDGNFCIFNEENCKTNSHRFRYLEQNMKNHEAPGDISFVNKDGQIFFNRNSCHPIHRQNLLKNYKIIKKETSESDKALEKELYEKNIDLYEDKMGIQRLKDTIDQRNGRYYFDIPIRRRQD